ncbi:MAG: dihydroorotate dehydrogenase electron transfer subunit, partial [Acidobacteriota bacterium]
MLSAVVRFQAPVLENRAHPHHVSILTVQAPEVASTVRPGQFVMAAVSGQGDIPSPLLKRALAVFTVPDREQNQITLLVKAVGEGTRRLTTVRPGDVLELVGPLGEGFDLERARNRISLIVVGGTGIASVHLLARELVRQGEEVALLYGGRSAEDLVGLAPFEQLGIPILTTTEDGSRGERGLVTDALRGSLERYPVQHLNVYTCGPNRMMQFVSEIVAPHRIPCQISVEIKMACG